MQTLNRKQFEKRIESNDNAVIINVLSPTDFEREHIPGSINIPLDTPDFVKKVEQRIADHNREVIVYCAGKECPASHNAAEKLEKAGYTNVAAFEGGMKDWKDARKHVESGNAERMSQKGGHGASGCC